MYNITIINRDIDSDGAEFWTYVMHRIIFKFWNPMDECDVVTVVRWCLIWSFFITEFESCK